MRLSIIIPVYHVAAWLPATLDCVLEQTYRDFELILVDDGATDGSGQICDDYAAKDPRVRVIHQKNAGVSAARNVGVAAARGEYIGFVDSDDIIEKDMFACLMSLAEEHGAEVAQCQHDRADTLNGAARTGEVRVMDGQEFVRRMFTKKGGAYTNQVALWSKIYKKELFDGIVFPVGQVYEDEQETYKLCLKAVRLVETDDVLYHYIKREDSIITGISPRKMMDKQAALIDRLDYLPQRMPELEGKCCRHFANYCESILCELYAAGAKDALEQAISAFRGQYRRLKPWLNKYERLYIPALRWKWARKLILSKGFEPIQEALRKIRK